MKQQGFRLRARIRRKRAKIIWVPKWGREFEGYAANFFRENGWRCDPIHGFDDLMQDAYLVFDKIVAAYPRVVEPRHFMALYKRALSNKTHDKASYRQRKDRVEIKLPTDVSEACLGRIGEITNSGYLTALLAEMPEELKLAMQAIVSGAADTAECRRWPQPRESLNMRLQKILNLPKGHWLHTRILPELKAYFSA